tara:strand:- start:920 stop:1816 length:897 start_codon:yes stop_codon:yes gene_type:complete
LNTYYLAIFGLVFTTFIWGITFEVVEESLKSIPPNIFNTIRFLIAAFCTFIAIIFKNRKISISKFEFKAGIICASLLALGYFFQSLGLWENSIYLKSDPNKSAFITGTSVLMVPIIMYIMNKSRVSKHLWISIFFVLLGMGILLNPNVEKFTIGDLLTFFCATSFAAHIIFQGNYLKDGINDIFSFFLSQTVFASLLFFIPSIVEINYLVDSIEFNSTVISGLIITGVFGTFIAIMIMVWAQKIVSPIQTAMIFSMEPVFAGLYNHFFTDHILTNWGIFAGVIIVLSIIYHEYKMSVS